MFLQGACKTCGIFRSDALLLTVLSRGPCRKLHPPRSNTTSSAVQARRTTPWRRSTGPPRFPACAVRHGCAGRPHILAPCIVRIKGAKVGGEGGAAHGAGARRPAPVESEAAPVSAHDGVRRDDLDRAPPRDPDLGPADPDESIETPEMQTGRGPPAVAGRRVDGAAQRPQRLASSPNGQSTEELPAGQRERRPQEAGRLPNRPAKRNSLKVFGLFGRDRVRRHRVRLSALVYGLLSVC